MKPLALILLGAALGLQAATIDFVEAPHVDKRVMPQSGNAVFSYHDAIKDSTGAIVHIATTQNVKHQNLPQINPFFEQFFGPGFRAPQQAPKRHGLGSGVIISKDGYIVTNNHVIDEADEIVVAMPGSSKEYEAKVIGTDPGTDIAVIKIEPDGDLPVIKMGSSDNLQVGDVVFAIGNPYGIGQTVTQGIISAQHKSGIGINKYENYIQTDASINPGNSGGALVDSRGALIGINTAIITRSGGNHGVGFAIEVDMVKEIARKLIEDGSVERGYLGVSIAELQKNMHSMYKSEDGALVADVSPDTPAAKAGLKRGDLIVNVNDAKVASPGELQNIIGRHTPGTKVTITYERDKKLTTVKVTLDTLKQTSASQLADSLDGVGLSELDDTLRYRYRIAAGVEGVVVTEVENGSEAEDQGLREGDVIIQIEEKDIRSLEDLTQALDAYKDDYKRVYINRSGRVYVAVLK